MVAESYKDYELDVARQIWEIAQQSPYHGNLVMDILGISKYNKVSKLVEENKAEIVTVKKWK